MRLLRSASRGCLRIFVPGPLPGSIASAGCRCRVPQPSVPGHLNSGPVDELRQISEYCSSTFSEPCTVRCTDKPCQLFLRYHQYLSTAEQPEMSEVSQQHGGHATAAHRLYGLSCTFWVHPRSVHASQLIVQEAGIGERHTRAYSQYFRTTFCEA